METIISQDNADVAYQKEFAINNLMAVYPNLILPELVAVQPMLSEIGKIVYLRATYGSNKGKFTNGDTMLSNFNLGSHAGDATYSSDQVEGEALPEDISTNGYNIQWYPVEPGSITLFDSTGTLKYRDDGNGNIIATGSTTASFTVNYATGAVAAATGAPTLTGYSINYVYNNMDIPVMVPEIDIKLVSNPIQARSRKLKVRYSLDASNFMTNDYGISIPAEALALSSAQLKREMDDEVITDLATLGTAAGVSWDATIPEGISLVDHYAGFPAAITEASNNIWNATQIAEASWIIVGPEAANIIEAIPRFKSSGVLNPKGSHLAGWIGNLPVYKSMARGIGQDGWVVGYKGDTLSDTGYVHAPFIPILATQLLEDADTFAGKQGFSTAYGKRMVAPEFYGRSIITHS